MSGDRGDQFTTAVGVFADSAGIVQWITDEVARDSRGQVVSVHRQRTSALEPASKYASFQPSSIPVRWRHRGVLGDLGRVVLLDRRSNRLAAVAVLQGPASLFTADMPPLYWSSGTRDDGQLTLTEISLTPDPATNGLAPVQFFDGLPNAAKGSHGAPWALLNTADELLKGVYDPMEVRCRFDDPDRPRSALRAAEPMEMMYSAPIGRVIAVNGRPPRGLR